MQMSTMIRAACAALVLTAVVAPVANAAIGGRPASTARSGPYDNTANSLGGRWVGGGGSG
jgi:hypothetical protein